MSSFRLRRKTDTWCAIPALGDNSPLSDNESLRILQAATMEDCTKQFPRMQLRLLHNRPHILPARGDAHPLASPTDGPVPRATGFAHLGRRFAFAMIANMSRGHQRKSPAGLLPAGLLIFQTDQLDKRAAPWRQICGESKDRRMELAPAGGITHGFSVWPIFLSDTSDGS
jgi:hypothetical protein